MPLSQFHPVISEWFRGRFGQPTEVQQRSWPAIASGKPVLIAAPTGSGKTLAAFLSCIDSLFKQALAGELTDETQVLYVSPLKALSNDVQKNLQQPLTEIAEAAMAAGLLMPELRVTVRTGDTPVWDRQQMLRRPPHILITTPESLFLLLTAEKSRRILRSVRSVIVDEIHALAPNKRGAHLSLSLARLDVLTPQPPVRIGLSATQRPIELIAQFLVGTRPASLVKREASLAKKPTHDEIRATNDVCIVDVGHRRAMDLAVEVPRDELGAVATNAIWADIYDRLADLVRAHRSTLVFVNTRRLVERVSHHLEERLKPEFGEQAVAAHHGSLSRQIRLSAEERLKKGQTRVVIATASLELGIDIGAVDLVCQVGSPRSIAVGLQRIGRSGHWVGAMPKGRLFTTTRDELIECAALVRAIRAGTLDRIEVPSAPLDILAQQMVASAVQQEWREEELFARCRCAYPYRDLTRADFDAVLSMLSDGITSSPAHPGGAETPPLPGSRGRRTAYLHHDRINHRIRARRGARLAAITSGGAIPDTANYAVVAEPEGTVVGSVDEDFAVESLAGDIILLGNASWRIRGVETGKVRVEDAHGAPPTIPFWRGEAPGRTAELSAEVAAVRCEIERLIEGAPPPAPSSSGDASRVTLHTSPLDWLQSQCGLDRRGAEQALAYVLAGRAVLGTVPTQQTIIAERFFDEGGGMQLVLHAPFGGRLNRAWGLALRKRFCATFDFELQAAATDEGIVLSLGEKHSFPLESIFGYLQANTVREVLVQATLQAPMFMTRWRWNASRALALLRFVNGRKVPPQIQRMRAEDLLTAVFPAATGCQDNHQGGPREVPDHPLVRETIRDCLTEAMDVEGLEALLRGIESGAITCLARDTPAPSPFCHEILNANPYAYLDDAPLEERRARAVEMRRSLPADLADNLGALSPEAIAEVAEESWPVVRDPDELHDALLTLTWLPEKEAPAWACYLPPLLQAGRAVIVTAGRGELETRRAEDPVSPHRPVVSVSNPVRGWTAVERLPAVLAAFSDAEIGGPASSGPAVEQEEAIRAIVQGWMESTGPTTAEELAARLALSVPAVNQALIALEAGGQVLRGRFRPAGSDPIENLQSKIKNSGAAAPEGGSGRGVLHGAPSQVEWCDRRLLARIHRLTIGMLRKEIEPVAAADFMRFLFQWQHVSHGARLHGEQGLLEVVGQLAGFEAAASSWERHLLANRLSKYDPEWLDRLCLGGMVSWGRLSRRPRVEPVADSDVSSRGRRIVPTSVAPISLFPREALPWLLEADPDAAVTGLAGSGWQLTPVAQDLHRFLQASGASFFADLVAGTGHLPSEVEQGLWEMAAAGLVTADGFDNLRALLDPRRRRAEGHDKARRPARSAGRWSLLRLAISHQPPAIGSVEDMARQLLRRYGVVFRDLLGREALSPAWRDLLVQYRRLESRGEIRGGRFVSGFVGEQFALPEAVEALRAMRRGQGRVSARPGWAGEIEKSDASHGREITLSAADPLNLAGIILPGPRVPAISSNYVVFRDGLPVRSGTVREVRPTIPPPSEEGGVVALSRRD